MELTLSELQEMATRQQQQIEAQQQMLVAKVTSCLLRLATSRSPEYLNRPSRSAGVRPRRSDLAFGVPNQTTQAAISAFISSRNQRCVINMGPMHDWSDTVNDCRRQIN